MSHAYLLVHPKGEDTNPMVLTEAAYFGCPSISVKRFAIPELVIHGKTGVVLDWPVQPHELAIAVHHLLECPDVYRRMRLAAFEFSRSECDWTQIGNRMARVIDSKLEHCGK